MELWAAFAGGRWEHIDTASTDNSKEYLLGQYRLAFGRGWFFEWRN